MAEKPVPDWPDVMSQSGRKTWPCWPDPLAICKVIRAFGKVCDTIRYDLGKAPAVDD